MERYFGSSKPNRMEALTVRHGTRARPMEARREAGRVSTNSILKFVGGKPSTLQVHNLRRRDVYRVAATIERVAAFHLERGEEIFRYQKDAAVRGILLSGSSRDGDFNLYRPSRDRVVSPFGFIPPKSDTSKGYGFRALGAVGSKSEAICKVNASGKPIFIDRLVDEFRIGDSSALQELYHQPLKEENLQTSEVFVSTPIRGISANTCADILLDARYSCTDGRFYRIGTFACEGSRLFELHVLQMLLVPLVFARMRFQLAARGFSTFGVFQQTRFGDDKGMIFRTVFWFKAPNSIPTEG